MSVRVKIILSKIFKDYRKEAYILLRDGDQNFKYVRDFESHIQKLFNIQFGIYLTIGDSFLPSCEHISVIQSGDTIIINKLSEEDSHTVNEINHQQTIEVDNQSNDENNPFKRGKRIRKRRKKQTTEKVVEEDIVSKVKIDEPAPIVQPRSKKSHIRFSDDFDDTTDLPLLSDNSPAKYLDNLQARVIRPVTVLSDANAGSLGSGDSQALNKPLSIEKSQRGIDSLRDIATNSNFAEVAASIDYEQIIKTIDDSVNFVPLKDEPKVYDVIAFKMLKIGKNYEPQLSEWIIAMVKDVEDGSVVVHVLAGVEETACPDGKLSMSMAICGEDENESADMLTLKREDLLNARVLLQ